GPPAGEKWLCVLPPKLERFPLPLAEAPPRCGGTLGGVTRPKSTLAPRMRQAPDGGKSGGNQPPGPPRGHPSSLRVPTLPMDTWLKEKRRQTSEKLLPTLDIGSHINAQAHLLPEAGAQRTLEAVGCSGLILIEAPSPAYHGGMLIAGNYHS